MHRFLGFLFSGALLFGLAVVPSRAQPKVVPARVIDEPAWVFPLQAERAGLRFGEVRAVLSISEEGLPLDFLVVGSTHLAFAEEVASGMPKLRFSPARLRGEPTTVRMPFSFYFQREGSIVSLGPTEQWEAQVAQFTTRDEFQSWLCPSRELDRPLTPVRMPSPRYPDELRSRAEPGVVEIDFFVDATGRVRLPAAEAGAHPSFAREAVAALSAWTFEPPTRHGQPAIVRATQTFRFSPPEKEKKR